MEVSTKDADCKLLILMSWRAGNPGEGRKLFLEMRIKAGGKHTASPAYLLDVFVALLTVALPRQGFFRTLLLTRLQIKGVALNFLDDVLLLHFPLKTPQGALKSLTILDVDFCQKNSPTSRNGYTSDRKARRSSPEDSIPAEK